MVQLHRLVYQAEGAGGVENHVEVLSLREGRRRRRKSNRTSHNVKDGMVGRICTVDVDD